MLWNSASGFLSFMVRNNIYLVLRRLILLIEWLFRLLGSFRWYYGCWCAHSFLSSNIIRLFGCSFFYSIGLSITAISTFHHFIDLMDDIATGKASYVTALVLLVQHLTIRNRTGALPLLYWFLFHQIFLVLSSPSILASMSMVAVISSTSHGSLAWVILVPYRRKHLIVIFNL